MIRASRCCYVCCCCINRLPQQLRTHGITKTLWHSLSQICSLPLRRKGEALILALAGLLWLGHLIIFPLFRFFVWAHILQLNKAEKYERASRGRAWATLLNGNIGGAESEICSHASKTDIWWCTRVTSHSSHSTGTCFLKQCKTGQHLIWFYMHCTTDPGVPLLNWLRCDFHANSTSTQNDAAISNHGSQSDAQFLKVH